MGIIVDGRHYFYQHIMLDDYNGGDASKVDFPTSLLHLITQVARRSHPSHFSISYTNGRLLPTMSRHQ